MKDRQLILLKTLNHFPLMEGFQITPVPGVYCTKFSKTDKRTKRYWRACLGIVVQGSKEIVLGRKVYRCDVDHYTATPIHLPVISQISSASIDKPFLALLIALDAQLLSEVSAQLEEDFIKEKEMHSHPQGLFIGEMNNKILEATIRLVQLFQNPKEARVLGPLIVKELIYHLMRSENGAAIHQFARSGSKMHRIAQAIHTLRSELEDDVNVEALAKKANMSRSAFFKYFKEVTAVSPIQYQKKLRLLEARRLMIEDNETAEGSAFKVGYKSASQFSREYSRLFGTSPLRDAVKIKKTHAVNLEG